MFGSIYLEEGMAVIINKPYLLKESVINEINALEALGYENRVELNLLANSLHQSWQEGARASGLSERWKDIKKLEAEDLKKYLESHAETTRKGEKYFQVNILGLENSELPLEHQEENLRSAAHAIGTWNQLLRPFDRALVIRNLESIKKHYEQLSAEELSKDLDKPGCVWSVIRAAESSSDLDALEAIFHAASKIHDAWIHRASSWLDPSSIQARPFHFLNDYNQKADLNILFALSRL